MTVNTLDGRMLQNVTDGEFCKCQNAQMVSIWPKISGVHLAILIPQECTQSNILNTYQETIKEN